MQLAWSRGLGPGFGARGAVEPLAVGEVGASLRLLGQPEPTKSACLRYVDRRVVGGNSHLSRLSVRSDLWPMRGQMEDGCEHEPESAAANTLTDTPTAILSVELPATRTAVLRQSRQYRRQPMRGRSTHGGPHERPASPNMRYNEIAYRA
jgi:hypothetical protein